jgi:hypothetical protein
MPWMPDTMPSLSNGAQMQANGNASLTTLELETHGDIKAAEKRILSSTESLNEILSLNALINVRGLYCGKLIVRVGMEI